MAEAMKPGPEGVSNEWAKAIAAAGDRRNIGVNQKAPNAVQSEIGYKGRGDSNLAKKQPETAAALNEDQAPNETQPTPQPTEEQPTSELDVHEMVAKARADLQARRPKP